MDADDQPVFESSAQISAQAPASASSSSSQSVSFVTAEQFEAMNDKWSEQFARFEALLSRGNVFTIPKVVSSLPSQTIVSAQPFINPVARHIGPVVSPAVQKELYKKGEAKRKKKKQKSSKKDKAVPDSVPRNPVKDIPGPGDDDDMPELVFQPVQTSTVAPTPGSKFTGSEEAFTGSASKITGSSSLFTEGPIYTGQESALPVGR